MYTQHGIFTHRQSFKLELWQMKESLRPQETPDRHNLGLSLAFVQLALCGNWHIVFSELSTWLGPSTNLCRWYDGLGITEWICTEWMQQGSRHSCQSPCQTVCLFSSYPNQHWIMTPHGMDTTTTHTVNARGPTPVERPSQNHEKYRHKTECRGTLIALIK